MSEKLRAAVFDILGPIDGTTVLDAYAGSGAIGFEAYSRGARRVVAVEQSAAVVSVIRLNALGLDIQEEYSVVQQSLESWVTTQNDKHFDIIIADPPYEQIQKKLLEKLGNLLVSSGIMAISHTSKIVLPELQSLSLIKTKTYGDSALSFYRRSK